MSTTMDNPLVHNSDSKGLLWVEVTIPILVLTYAIVIVRIWWRHKVVRQISLSDLFILISLLCATIQEILGCIAVLKWGLGHHAAYIGAYKTRKSLLYFYTYQVFYKTLVGTTKLSFVCLYLEIFPKPWFTRLCYAVNASIIAAIIAFDAATVFQCTPVPYFWDRSIEGGHCIATAAFWYGHAAWNTIADVLVLALPIPVIRSLRMGKNQKIAVVGVFGLGAFVIVASVMRMIALDPASKTAQADMTYLISTSNAFLWTQVEASVAIICACLPTLKGPILRLVPKLFSPNSQPTQEPYNLENSGNFSSVNWRGQSRRQNIDENDDTSSQKRMIVLRNTVDITYAERASKKTTAEQQAEQLWQHRRL